MQALLDSLDAIAECVDRGAWEDAAQALSRHDAAVRAAVAAGAVRLDAWRELIQRHSALTLKLTALRSDALQALEQARREHVATQRYLSTGGA